MFKNHDTEPNTVPTPNSKKISTKNKVLAALTGLALVGAIGGGAANSDKTANDAPRTTGREATEQVTPTSRVNVAPEQTTEAQVQTRTSVPATPEATLPGGNEAETNDEEQTTPTSTALPADSPARSTLIPPAVLNAPNPPVAPEGSADYVLVPPQTQVSEGVIVSDTPGDVTHPRTEADDPVIEPGTNVPTSPQ